jgi:hypothetical protein
MKKQLILFFTLIFSFQVYADNLEDSNKLFAWAETNYPNFFSPPNPETIKIETYWVRPYANDTYLGTQGNDVFVSSPLFFNGKVTKVGVISDFTDVYNPGTYDDVKLLLSQDEAYQSLKSNLNQDAINGGLGESFVSSLEERVTQLLISGKSHQVNIIKKKLDFFVDKAFLSGEEQQAILGIYGDLLAGNIPQAQSNAASFVAIATTDLGKQLASDLQGYVDKSTVDQQASNSENVGEAAGAILGAGAGFIAGGGSTAGTGALPAASLGALIGSKVGKAIGGLLGGLFGGGNNNDNGDSGDTGGDTPSGGDTDG